MTSVLFNYLIITYLKHKTNQITTFRGRVGEEHRLPAAGPQGPTRKGAGVRLRPPLPPQPVPPATTPCRHVSNI